MKNLEQINLILSEYENLKRLVKHQIEILVKIDSNKFYTGRYIENIFFNKYDDNIVEIEYDDGHSNDYCKYPLQYLSLSDEELIQVAQNDLNQRIEHDRIVREQNLLTTELQRKATELELYNMLKRKYEN